MKYNEVLKELRLSNNLLQKDIAKICNVNPATYQLWESGKTQPDIENLCKIAEYYKTSVDYILGRLTEDNIIIMTQHLSTDEEELLEDYNMLGAREKNYLKGYIIRLKEETIKKVR